MAFIEMDFASGGSGKKVFEDFIPSLSAKTPYASSLYKCECGFVPSIIHIAMNYDGTDATYEVYDKAYSTTKTIRDYKGTINSQSLGDMNIIIKDVGSSDCPNGFTFIGSPSTTNVRIVAME